MRQISLFLLILFFSMHSTVYSKMYKWLDEEGVTQFSTFPPDNINEDYQTLSGNRASQKTLLKLIHGDWLFDKNNNQYQLRIHRSGMSINPISSRSRRTNTRTIIEASWTLSGKILTLQYSKHNNQKLYNSSESFFVVKANEKELVLLSKKTNIKTHYRSKSYYQSTETKHSAYIQKMIGKWNASKLKRVIEFSRNGKFKIRSTQDKFRSTLFSGNWRFSNQILRLYYSIDNNNPHSKSSKAGDSERFRIKTLSAGNLTIQNIKTKKIIQYYRKMTKN